MISFSVFRRGLFALALLVSPYALRAADDFQGQVEMKMTDVKKPNDSVTFHYTIKEHKMRFDLPMDDHSHHGKTGSMAMVIDYDTRQIVTLIASTDSNGAVRKMAMRSTLPEIKPHDPATASSADSAHLPVATGKTETILGYTANEYTLTEKNGDVIDMWLAKGIGNFMSPNGQGGMGRRPSSAAQEEWAKFASEAGLFPLRLVATKGTQEKFRMDVTKIDKSPVPDSVFSTEGYQEFQMPNLGNLFGH